MEEVIIIGGGIAGLSCLNALLDHNVSPLLIEGKAIGTPKMCGEFLAPTAVALLQNWNIGPVQSIREAHFFSMNKKLKLNFSQNAGAMARSEAEKSLAERAIKKSGRIRENSPIKKITPATNSSPYILHLESGEEILAKTAIFATGKNEQQPPGKLPYFGFKIHFKHVISPTTLLMYSHKNAYYGIVPISDEESNCACLIKKEIIEKIGSCKQFFDQLVESNESLRIAFQHTDIHAIDWFESRAPEFQAKKIPSWPNAYWIGDALAGLHPAIGSGFSHGISSAIMAAEFYLQNNPREYLRISNQLVKPKLFIGKLTHQLMLNPLFSFAALPFLQLNPWLLDKCLQRLGYKI